MSNTPSATALGRLSTQTLYTIHEELEAYISGADPSQEGQEEFNLMLAVERKLIVRNPPRCITCNNELDEGLCPCCDPMF